jgi:hypothetical protein
MFKNLFIPIININERRWMQYKYHILRMGEKIAIE